MKIDRTRPKMVLVGFALPVALFVALLFVALFAAGCGSNKKQGRNDETLEYAKLTRSLATQDKSLRAQLTALRESEQFPADLTSRGRSVAGKSGRKRPSESWLADDQNFAIVLAKLGPESKSSFRREVEKIDGMLASTSLPWTREAMERVASLLEQKRGDLKLIRQSLDLPQSDFGIRIDNGLLADLTGIQRSLLAGRTLAVATVFNIRRQKLEEAEEDISRLLHLANGLSHEPHLVPRVAGARIREDAFLAVRSICAASGLKEKQLNRLRRDVATTIAQWPDDALLWSGERAQGLHAFEMIRAGDLLSLLQDDELVIARNRGINDFAESIMEQVDEDEQFYMNAMATFIGVCDKPYYARVETINKVMLDIEQLDDDTRSAWLATNVLLGHVADGLYWQGHDRALSEAWLIALNAAATGEQPPERKNPLTGLPFRVQINELNVAVSGISDHEGGWHTPEPLIVPRLAQVAIRGRHLR